MTLRDLAQLALFFGVLIAAVPLLGSYMARVFSGERNLLSPVVGPIERVVYRLSGVDPAIEMRWTTYAIVLLVFNLLGFIILLILQLVQQALPLNPQNLPAVSPVLAFNTAISFVTNTNWQSYASETTLSYATQMLGLTVQNFVSAATGIAVILALTRGLARRSASTLGNFWADLIRATLYVLLPLSIVLALV